MLNQFYMHFVSGPLWSMLSYGTHLIYEQESHLGCQLFLLASILHVYNNITETLQSLSLLVVFLGFFSGGWGGGGGGGVGVVLPMDMRPFVDKHQ